MKYLRVTDLLARHCKLPMVDVPNIAYYDCCDLPDWWLERAEYDGSEWWEFKTMPELPEQFCEDEQEFAKLLRA